MYYNLTWKANVITPNELSSFSVLTRREDGGSGGHHTLNPAHSTQPHHLIGPQLCPWGNRQCQGPIQFWFGLLRYHRNCKCVFKTRKSCSCTTAQNVVSNSACVLRHQTEGDFLVYENQVRYAQQLLPTDDPLIHRDSPYRWLYALQRKVASGARSLYRVPPSSSTSISVGVLLYWLSGWLFSVAILPMTLSLALSITEETQLLSSQTCCWAELVERTVLGVC